MGGAAYVVLASAATSVIGLFTTVIVVRHLSAADFGTFVLLQVSCTFLAEVSTFGLALAIPQFIASDQDPQYRSDLVKTVVYFRLATIFIVIMAGLLAMPWMAGLAGSPDFYNLIIFAPFMFGIESIGKSLTSILQGTFRFRAIAVVGLISSISNLLLIVGFVLLVDQGLVSVIYAKIISTAISYAFAFIALSTELGGVFRSNILKRMLAFGLPLQLQYFMGFAYSRLDTFIIGALLGPAQVGYYSVAQRIPQSLESLYEAFRVVYLPFAAKLFALGEKQKLTELLKNSNRWLSFLTVSGALIVLLFGREIVVLIFSEHYLPSLPIFILLMIGLSFNCVENTLGYTLVAIGEPNKPLIVNVARAVASLLANLLLVPVFGVMGAAATTIVGNLVAIPLDLLFLYRRKIVAVVLEFVKPVLVFGACGLAFFFFGASFDGVRFAIIGVYGLGSVLLSVITVHDFEFVFREVSIRLVVLLHRRRVNDP